MATKVVTGKVRFSYVNIFKSRSFQQGQDAKFSICLLIPKEDKATIKKINATDNTFTNAKSTFVVLIKSRVMLPSPPINAFGSYL